MFHDSRKYLRTLNDLMLVAGSETYGNTFGECSSGKFVDAVQHSYPCVVRRAPSSGL